LVSGGAAVRVTCWRPCGPAPECYVLQESPLRGA